MDCIVSCAENLPWRDLAPFVLSARRFAPHARLVFFVNRLAHDTVGQLREAGVELHPLDARFPEGTWRTSFARHLLWRAGLGCARLLRYVEFCRRLELRWGGLILPRNQARFFVYRAWLEDCTQAGDRLLLCDSRDVVFQADPFPLFPPEGAFIAAEEPSLCIRRNSFNARWYRETYGDAQLARDGDRPVICAGVLGGERSALIRTIDAIVAESEHRPFRYGADQAIINHLHYAHRLGCRELENGDALVWHLYGVAANRIEVDHDWTIRDTGKTPCAIVHMYDRHEQALQAVHRRWEVPAQR